MRCRAVQAELDAYEAGELPVRVQERVEDHVESCPTCRAALTRLQQLTSLLRSVPSAPMPAGLGERLLAKGRERLRAEPAAAPWHPLRWWTALPVPMRLAAGAALAAGLALGTIMGRQTWHETPQPSRLAAPTDPAARAVYELGPLADVPLESLASAYLAPPAGPSPASQ